MAVPYVPFALENPVFQVYLATAALMLLKLMLQPWMTVMRMMRVKGGYRSPEDAKKSPINPTPSPAQLVHNEYVDRSRRMNLNDLETIPGFVMAGFIFVAAGPSLVFAQIVLWTFVVSRLCHFVAYATAQYHEVRATFWTIGSVSVLVMVGYTLAQVFRQTA